MTSLPAIRYIRYIRGARRWRRPTIAVPAMQNMITAPGSNKLRARGSAMPPAAEDAPAPTAEPPVKASPARRNSLSILRDAPTKSPLKASPLKTPPAGVSKVTPVQYDPEAALTTQYSALVDIEGEINEKDVERISIFDDPNDGDGFDEEVTTALERMPDGAKKRALKTRYDEEGADAGTLKGKYQGNSI